MEGSSGARPPAFVPILPRPSDSRAAFHPYAHPSPNDSPRPPPPLQKKKKPVMELPKGTVVMEKSCLRCRVRKVKCDRIYPICTNCIERKDECDLMNLPSKTKPSASAEADRIIRLEKRLAELELQVAAPSNPPSDRSRIQNDGSFHPGTNTDDAISPPSNTSRNIGRESLDWRLATPQMARSLSQHLCEAFFDSCCAFMPAFKYFRTRLSDYQGDPGQLPPAAKVAIATFCAIGARASPHSAVLGISAGPTDSRDHPDAPLLNAGTRRQSACTVLLAQAHALSFEQGLMDEATIENLAALVALTQMSIFVEFHPKRSRTLLRAVIGHFKDLQDEATTDDGRVQIKQSFALAIYSCDSITAAYARRTCLLNEEDLRNYFDHVGIVVPRMEGQELTPILFNLLNGSQTKEGMKTAVHLIACWTYACQRNFAKMFAPSASRPEDYETSIPLLWTAIDNTRSAVQYVQSIIYSSPPPSHSHAPGSEPHFHETDYLSQIIRADRDLIDLLSMVHTGLLGVRAPGLPRLVRESEGRVRKGLKVLAFYAKVYISGADGHMIFHHAFQLEHNPQWTRMALQRIGEPGGPQDESEQVSDIELGWFIEGLQHACFYMPSAERRLAELSPRFTQVEPLPSPTFSPEPYVRKGTADVLERLLAGTAGGEGEFESLFGAGGAFGGRQY